MLNISSPTSSVRTEPMQSVQHEVRSHPATAARMPHQAIQDFLGEVVSALVEPISSAFAENLYSAGEDDDEEQGNTADSSLFKELGRSCWGKTLLQSGQFQSMTRSIEDSLRRLEVSQQQRAVDQQCVIRGA